MTKRSFLSKASHAEIRSLLGRMAPFTLSVVVLSACGDSVVADAVSAEDGGRDAGAEADAGARDAGTSDGGVDACTKLEWYADKDDDGLGDPVVNMKACVQPAGYVDNADDKYPGCGRTKAPANCTVASLRCASGSAVGRAGRENCTEDTAYPGCTDWVSASECGADTPVCSGDGACSACSEHADCSNFAGTPSCSDSGSCVECTPDTETSACDASKDNRACDPIALTCTGEPRGTVGACGGPITAGDKRVVRCVSDSECAVGNKCVVMSFHDQPYGNYCLLEAPVGLCPDQYAAKKSATSVGGVVGDYCFPREKLTTCEAVNDFAAPCTADTDCGRADVADGHCEGPDGAKRCTYACASDRDCSGTTCSSSGSGTYCNPN